MRDRARCGGQCGTTIARQAWCDASLAGATKRAALRYIDLPMLPSDDTPLTDIELDELEDFLIYELEAGMDISTLDGFFTALLCGPTLFTPGEWLPWVWDAEQGEQVPNFKSQGEARRIIGMLTRYMNEIAVTLYEAVDEFEPLLLESPNEGDPVPVLDEWCWGFMKGVSLDEYGWQPLLDAHPEWLSTIMLYGTEEGMQQQDEREIPIEEHRELADGLPESVRNIYRWWLERRMAAEGDDEPDPRVVVREPIRNPDKVGRNDPCPCGSGKKFKHCHGGGSPTLH